MKDKQLRKALADAGMLYESVHQVATTMSIKDVHVLSVIKPNLEGISSQLSALHLRINALAEALGFEFRTEVGRTIPPRTIAIKKKKK